MATIRYVLGILCLVIFGCFTEPSGHLLAGGEVDNEKAEGIKVEGRKGLGLITESLVVRGQRLGFAYKITPDPYAKERMRILQIAMLQLGVREATGRNDGKAVAAYLQTTGLKEGYPWCAAFVSWVFKTAGYAQPRTAWSPALFPKARQSLEPLPANLFGIYYANLKRIAHVGFVVKKEKSWIISIEGNTNMDGSREGNGVYQKRRHMRTIYAYADWIAKGGGYEKVH